MSAAPLPIALAVKRFDRLAARYDVHPAVLAAMNAVVCETARQAMVAGAVLAGGSVEDALARYEDVLALAMAYQRARQGAS